MRTDTIAAIATAMSSSGIGIIRISGEDAVTITEKIFRMKNGKKLSEMPTHTIHYGHICDGEEVIDEVMVLLMRGPKSYTREDTVEIDCHGGMHVMQQILHILIQRGARLADPGEFTKRAFLNGRIDLSQAESVMDLISAKSDLAAKTAVSQLKGSLKNKIISLRDLLIHKVAYIESALDDPEHYDLDGFSESLDAELEGMEQEMDHLIKTAEDGKMMREGICTVILGKPNAGKSSVLNVLTGKDRAIVTDIAGTTRDAIDTEYENQYGKYVLIDTAGIRKKSKVKESIEKFSIMRTLLAIERADVCLMMIDANEGVTEQDAKIAGEAHEAGKGVIIAVNKWDEYEKETGTLEKYKKEIYNKLSYLSYAPIIFISAKTGQRVDKIFDMINTVARNNAIRVSTSMLNQVINEAIAVVQPPTDKGRRLRCNIVVQYIWQFFYQLHYWFMH